MLICRRSSGGCADCLPPVRVLFLSAKHLFLAAKPRSGGVRAVGVFRALCNQPPAAPLMEACWSFAEWVTASAMALLAGKPSLPLSVGWPRRDSAEGGTCVIFGGGYPLGWRTPRDPR
jgi:hypothetical protein